MQVFQTKYVLKVWLLDLFDFISVVMSDGKNSTNNLHLFPPPQYLLLLLGTVFGLLFVFVTPPALVGDEPNHFFRAYQISEGHIIGEKREDLSGGWIPKSVLYTNRQLVGDIEMNHHVKFDINLFSQLNALPLNDEDKVFERFPNTVVYTPVPYLPQVLGILIGKSFNVSALSLIYLARIVNLYFFLALAYLAIKITPVHKWVFCLLCLTPTNVFQVASASADAFTYGICFLAIAYFLFYAFGESNMLENGNIVKIFAVSLAAVLCKQAYVFLPLLFLLIPHEKFSSVKTYLFTFLSLLGACFVSVAAWSAAIKPIYLPYRIDQPMSPEEQMQFIIGNPFNFIWMVVKDYYSNFWFYFQSFSGQLTWFDLYVPNYLPVILFFVLTGLALADKDLTINISWSNKFVFCVILVCTAFLISTLLYMTWSPIRGSNIEGIQGRYFIPVAPLFFLLFYNKKVKWIFFDRHADKIVYVTVVVSLLITLNTVVRRYYV